MPLSWRILSMRARIRSEFAGSSSRSSSRRSLIARASSIVIMGSSVESRAVASWQVLRRVLGPERFDGARCGAPRPGLEVHTQLEGGLAGWPCPRDAPDHASRKVKIHPTIESVERDLHQLADVETL